MRVSFGQNEEARMLSAGDASDICRYQRRHESKAGGIGKERDLQSCARCRQGDFPLFSESLVLPSNMAPNPLKDQESLVECTTTNHTAIMFTK